MAENTLKAAKYIKNCQNTCRKVGEWNENYELFIEDLPDESEWDEVE